MGYKDNGISLTYQDTKKMSNITTQTALWQHLYNFCGIQGTHFLIICMEFWLNEGYLLVHVRPFNSIEEAEQFWREWRTREAIYNSVFEDLDRATFTTAIQSWYSTLPPELGSGHWYHSKKPSHGTRHLSCWAIHQWSWGNWQIPKKMGISYGKDLK